MTYSNWKLRREVMACTELPEEVRFHLLIIIDHVDWTTGIKQFHSKSHFNNWIKRLSETYGVEEKKLSESITGGMEFASFGTLSTKTRTLTLKNVPPVEDDSTDEW